MKKSTYGFREWTANSVNCCTGCSNNCRYCYAKGMAIRFKRLTADEWPIERVRQKDVDRRQGLYTGRMMFPSSHDITPGNFEACMTVLDKLIGAGNEVLIVSKPRYDIIREICLEFLRGQGQDTVPVYDRCDERRYSEVLGAGRPLLRGKT